MAYGRQFRTTRADSRLRPDYVAGLNRKLQYLPQRLAQQQAEQQHQDRLAMDERRLAQMQTQFSAQQKMLKKQYAMAERENEVATGLEAGKLGVTMAMKGGPNLKDKLTGMLGAGGSVPGRGHGGSSLAGGTGGKGLFSKISGPGTVGGSLKESMGKYLGHLNLSNTIGAGLAGFGASKLFGGGKKDNKLKKIGIGAAAGGLMSLFTGGSGSGGKDIITGSLFGGLGGLF